MAEKEADPKPETDAEENAQGQEGEAPKKSKKKLIILAALIGVLVLGGLGAYFSGVLGGHDKGEVATNGEEGHGGGGKAGESVYFDLPEFLVNLNTTSRQTSFLKMTVALELSSPEDAKNIEAKLPRIVDSFNTYLRELRVADLYGSAGVYRLREELLVRVNKSAEPIKVKDILFKQFLVQ